jgi:arylsulfatase A-like enzyme
MIDEDRPVTLKGYISDELADEAIRFIDGEAERAEPFWLSLNFTAPHYPWIDCHPEEFTALYADCPFETCPDEAPHPDFAGGSPAVEKGREDRRPNLVGYFAAVSAMDAAIGRVVGHLAARGLTGSTLVVFISDNGMNCGHHGIWGKGNGTRPQNMYDTSVKVPCIVSMPGRLREGAVAEGLFSAYDVWPTVVELLGLAPEGDGGRRPGRSFAGLLEKGAADTREAVVVFDEYGPVRMVRTRDWKYVHRFPDGPHELYHLAADPGERRNLIGEADAAGQLAELRTTLADWFRRFADPETDGADWGVTGAGQLALARPGTPREAAFASVPIAALKKAR